MATPRQYMKQLWIFVAFGAVAGALAGLAIEKEGFAHLQAFFTGAMAGQWNAEMAAVLSMLLGGVAVGVSVMVLAWAMWTKSKERAVQ